MSNAFRYLKKNCPVCAGERQDCRQNISSGLIHCRSDRTAPSKFRLVGMDQLGFGMWAEGEGGDRQWQERLDQRRQQQEEAKQQRAKKLLSVVERDRQFRRVARHSGLSQFHRVKLEGRGLTYEQVKQAYDSALLWTWQNGAGIPGVSPSLPGSDAKGVLRKYPKGFAVAVADPEGKILGCQIRIDSPKEKSPKYLWVSSENVGGNGIYLPSSEVPIGFYRPFSGECGGAINLAEGFLKPFIIAQKHGVLCLGAASANFVGSPQLFQEYLEVASGELGTKAIVLNADAGSVSNIHVIGQYRKVWALAEEWGYQVSIRWWGQIEKTSGDADEISSDVFSSAKLLSVSEFEAIASEHLPRTDQAGAFKVATAELQHRLHTLSSIPTVAASGRYITPELVPDLKRTPSGIILASATMGTGKDYTFLRKLVAQHLEEWRSSARWMFTARNSQGIQSGNVVGLPHHSTPHSPAYRGEGTSCLESIHLLTEKHLQRKRPLVIWNEISQILEQVFASDETTADSLPFIIQRIAYLIRAVKLRNGWIVLAEDGISDVEVQFIQDAAGGNFPVVYHLDFKKEVNEANQRIYTLHSSCAWTWSELIHRIGEGESVFCASDSQKFLRETERFLTDRGIEGVYILDTDTNPDEAWRELAETNPDEFVRQYKPKFFGISPKCQSTWSLNDKEKHFSSCCVYITHLPWTSAKQLPDRLRTDVPRFGYVQERAAFDDATMAGSRPDAILRMLDRNVEGVKKLIGFDQLIDAESKTPDQANGIRAVLQKMEDRKDDPTTPEGLYRKYKAIYTARNHYDKQSIRKDLVAFWESQGHIVVEGNSGKHPLTEERDRIRCAMEWEESQKRAEADISDISLDDARAILQNPNASKDERRIAHKRLLADKLPTCDLNSPDFVYKATVTNRGKFLKTAELLWLSRNPEAAKELDRRNWFGAFSAAERRGEIVITHRLSTKSAQAKLLSECPLEPFLSGRVETWTNSTPEAIAVAEWAYSRRLPLKRYRRLNIKPVMPANCPSELKSQYSTPCQIVNKILKSLGFECEQVERKGSRGNQVRYWAVTNLHDADRDEILRSLTLRFEEKQSRQALRNGSHDLHSIQDGISANRDYEPQSGEIARVGAIGDSLNHEATAATRWAGVPKDFQADLQEAWSQCQSDSDRQSVVALYEETRRLTA